MADEHSLEGFEGLEGRLGGESPEAASGVAGHTIKVQQLFVKHQSGVKAFILSLLPNFVEADDVLQETFLVVTRKACEFSLESNFMSWSLTIARFKVLEALRRRKRTEDVLSQEVIETLSASAPDDAFREERLAAVRSCLEKLTPHMQEVLRLRYFGEHGPGEIARLINWTTNSVNVALSNARKLMYECVGRHLGKG